VLVVLEVDDDVPVPVLDEDGVELLLRVLEELWHAVAVDDVVAVLEAADVRDGMTDPEAVVV
jgi:hypothetical protein